MFSIKLVVKPSNRTARAERGAIDPRIRAFVETVWHYHRMHHDVTPADAILVLCSHDLRVADRGAELYLDDSRR